MIIKSQYLVYHGSVKVEQRESPYSQNHQLWYYHSWIQHILLIPIRGSKYAKADGAISLISFTVNRGAGGTQLLAGAALNYVEEDRNGSYYSSGITPNKAYGAKVIDVRLKIDGDNDANLTRTLN